MTKSETMKLPSKELLYEVLGYKIDYISLDGTWAEINNPMAQFNIYELAHLCKEWAIKQGVHQIASKHYHPTDFPNEVIYYCFIEIMKNGRNKMVDFKSDFSEPEAIFKATSYIMEQLKQKD